MDITEDSKDNDADNQFDVLLTMQRKRTESEKEPSKLQRFGSFFSKVFSNTSEQDKTETPP
jgi:hypothetical protein